jgi:cephalosporin hydroxylase
VETGVARGGSVLFMASMLELIGKGKVIGVDIDL